jgi:dipeptidyl aminopeptidase/acylaminoacyl peptidase
MRFCTSALLVALVSPSLALGAGKRPLSVDDLYRLDVPTAPALSPDGRRLVYSRHWIDPITKQDRYSLWQVEKAGKARPLEEYEPDGQAPVWSPDGKWIAFLSTRPRPKGWKQIPATPPQSDIATDVWLLPIGGGPAMPLAGPKKPYGRVFNDGFYGRIAFSHDGKRLVLVADDGKDPRTSEEIKAGVRIVRPDGGEGYTGYGPAQVWVADLKPFPAKWAAQRIERVTGDDFWYGDPQWAPDGSFLVVHANRTKDQGAVRWTINRNYDLWALDLKTHKLKQLTTGPGPEVSPRISPDGKHIVCLSVPRIGSHRDVFHLLLVTLGPTGPRTRVLLAPRDHGDVPEVPVFPLPNSCWIKSDTLFFHMDIGTRTLDAWINFKTGDEIVARARKQKLMPAGNAFLKDRILGKRVAVTWNSDGKRIEGLLTVPPASVAKPPYKLLLHPHGGPHSRSAAGFDFTAQLFAAHGYAVFEPNYRGSHGYGQKFIDADRFDFGGGDVRDIQAGIAYLIKQGLVDKDHQFVYGSSYGGFLTCWLVGHSNQFRAAVAQNAVTDMKLMWGLSDIQNWVEWEVGDPWKSPEKLRAHSPLTYAGNVQTPTLVLHSRDDRRVPLPNGVLFYHALKDRGVPTGMVIYPDEGHAIRQPRHRADVLRRVLAWFARYDKK